MLGPFETVGVAVRSTLRKLRDLNREDLLKLVQFEVNAGIMQDQCNERKSDLSIRAELLD